MTQDTKAPVAVNKPQHASQWQSLRISISVRIFLIVLIILGLFSAFDIYRTFELRHQEQQDQLHVTTERLANVLWVPVYDYNRAQIEKFVSTEMQHQDVQAIVVKDAVEGKTLCALSKDSHQQIVAAPASPSFTAFMSTSAEIIRKSDPLGSVTIYYTDAYLKQEIYAHILRQILSALALGVVIFLSLLYTITRNIVEPIHKMDETFKHIAAGDLDQAIEVERTDEIGGLARSFAAMRDSIKGHLSILNNEITERKRAEEALQRQEDNLKTTLHSIGDAVISTDIHGYIIQMNPVAEELTGWTFEETNGKSLSEVFNVLNMSTRKPIEDSLHRILNQGSVASHQSILISKDNNSHYISDSGSIIESENYGILGVVIVFRDISEELALQDQLRQSQKMDAIGKLAGGIAHDFNNMIGGILGAAEIIQRNAPENKKVTKYAQMIIDASEQAAALTRQLLTFARKQPAVNAVIDMHECIEDTVALLKNTIDKRVNVEVLLPAEQSLVAGDHAQLQSALLNMCINAAHAMPQGGHLCIRTENRDLDAADCAASSFDLQAGPYLSITIKDDGTGMDSALLTRIFEPFFTTKSAEEGTGLGLAAVFGTVQQHKGSITVSSELGTGSTFTILLPLANDVKTNRISQSPINHGDGCILIVDDEEIMRETASSLLRELGYAVLLAENGKQGAEIYAENHTNIDLVILDMIMPEMNGRDCFHEMHKINPQVNAILTSGFAQVEDIQEMLDSGLVSFIRKPYRSAQLSKVVQETLQKNKH